MTEELSRDAILLDLRDEDCRVAMRELLKYRARKSELCEQDRKLWERMDELDNEQAKGE